MKFKTNYLIPAKLIGITLLATVLMASCLTGVSNNSRAPANGGVTTTRTEQISPVYESKDYIINVNYELIEADDEIREIERDDGIIKIYPVLGRFLQPTEYAAYMFCDKDGTPVGVQIDKRGLDTDKITADTVKDENLFVKKYDSGNGAKEWLILDGWLFEGYRFALDKWPSLEIVAFLQNNRMLVRTNGETRIKVYNYEYPEPEEMRYNGSVFETIEEGRKLAKEQIESLNTLAAQFGDFCCPGDAGIDRDAPDRDYYLRYGQYTGKTCATQYWEKTLTEGGNTRILRLFFNRFYEPIAEVVFEQTEPYTVLEGANQEERTKTYRIVYENVGEKENGEYLPLDAITYITSGGIIPGLS